MAKVQGSVYIRKRVSVTVEKICECFVILFFGLEGTESDSTGELTLASGSVGEVTTLGEDLLRVGVVRFVHADIIGTGEDGSGSNRDTLPTVHQGFSMIHSAAPDSQ